MFLPSICDFLTLSDNKFYVSLKLNEYVWATSYLKDGSFDTGDIMVHVSSGIHALGFALIGSNKDLKVVTSV